MKKTKNRFATGFILGMLAMAVAMASIGIGFYFSKQGMSRQTVSSETEDKLDRIEKIIDTYYLDEAD